jgi:hypothetical protein
MCQIKALAAARSRSTVEALFSPDSNSLRTMVISASRSLRAIDAWIMRSASTSST